MKNLPKIIIIVSLLLIVMGQTIKKQKKDIKIVSSYNKSDFEAALNVYVNIGYEIKFSNTSGQNASCPCYYALLEK